MYPNYPNQSGYPGQNSGNSYPNNPPYPTNNIGFPSYDSYGSSNLPNYSSQPGYPAPNYPNQANYDISYNNSTYNSNQNSGFPPYQPEPLLNNNYPQANYGYNPAQAHSNFNPPTNPGYNPSPAPSNFNSYPPSNPGYNPSTAHSNFNTPSNPGYNPSTAPSNFNSYPPTNPSVPPYYPTTSTTSTAIYPSLVDVALSRPNDPYGTNNYNNSTVTHYEGTVKPFFPFNPMDDATKLYKAMKGFGTNETALIDVLCKRTSAQRQEIAQQYKVGYGKNLLKNLIDETSGNFELMFKALMKRPIELEAHDLKEAIDGLGTNEDTVIDIMCTKTSSEMMELKHTFRQMYNKDLEREVGGDVSGYFKRLLFSLAAANRSNALPDLHKAVQQANELHIAGAKSLGTDEVTFNRIFASESYPHLRVVFDEYLKKTGKDIENAIKSEMSGSVEKAFLAIVDIARNPPAYYARRLYESMAGMGTRDRTLIRHMVLRSEIDMVQIKSEFHRKYGKSLESFIKGDCSGDYKRGLLCLAGDTNWR